MAGIDEQNEPATPWWGRFSFRRPASEPAQGPRNDDANQIEQRRSLFRLRFTFVLGLVITAGSASVLVWLLGLFEPSGKIDRSVLELQVHTRCAAALNAYVTVNTQKNYIYVNFLAPEPNAGGKILSMDSLLSERGIPCGFAYFMDGDLSSGVMADASFSIEPNGTRVPLPTDTKYQFNTNNAGKYVIEIDTATSPDFSGGLILNFESTYRSDGFSKYYTGLSLIVTNSQGIIRNTVVNIGLPSETALATAVRPEPQALQIDPVEAYHYRPTAAEDTYGHFVRFNNFISFQEPGEGTIREALLILASTLFGAGISALLEAFLAGGTQLWTRQRQVADDADLNKPRLPVSSAPS